jgi:hypothetical protein
MAAVLRARRALSAKPRYLSDTNSAPASLARNLRSLSSKSPSSDTSFPAGTLVESS